MLDQGWIKAGSTLTAGRYSFQLSCCTAFSMAFLMAFFLSFFKAAFKASFKQGLLQGLLHLFAAFFSCARRSRIWSR